MTRLIVAGLLGALFVATGLSAVSGASSLSGGSGASSGATARVAACANDQTAVGKLSAKKVRVAVVCLIDQERTRFGLPALKLNARLDAAAQAHTADMLRRDYFDHDSPSGATPPQRITAAGYKWAAWGENLAAGYPTAVAVVTAWMSDVGHCTNILFPAFADVGIGFVNKPLAKFASAPALWTEDFGLKSGSEPPSTNQAPARSCPHGL